MIKRIPGEKPDGYEPDLSDYGPWIRDPKCGKTIGWGFIIERRLSKDRFSLLRSYGSVECLHGPNLESTWHLITNWLTSAEAIEEYGPINHLVLGPMGGFRSVTYGQMTFISKRLDPRQFGIVVPSNLVLTMPKKDK